MARHSLNRQKRPPSPPPHSTDGRTDKRQIVFAPTFELAIILAEPRRKRRVRLSVRPRPSASVRPSSPEAPSQSLCGCGYSSRLQNACLSDRRSVLSNKFFCPPSQKHWVHGFGSDYRRLSNEARRRRPATGLSVRGRGRAV